MGELEVYHRNPLPVKPSTQIEIDRVIAAYQKNHDMMLGKLNAIWERLTALEEPVTPLVAGEPNETAIYEHEQKLKQYHADRHRILEEYDQELKHPTITFVK